MDIRWNKHVVILYDKDRDDKVAEALRFYIEHEFEPCDVVLIDNVAYTNRLVDVTTTAVQRFAVRHARGMLKAASERSEKRNLQRIMEQNKDRNSTTGEDRKHKSEVTRIVNILKRLDPVVMICTTPYALRMSLMAKKIVGKPVHVIGAVTDFALDPAFVQFGADGYFVENPEVKQKLIHYGIEGERISVIGMPSLMSENEMSVADKKKALGVSNDLPVVVVDGGPYGTDTIREDIVTLMRNRKDYNLIIITSNKATKRYYMEQPDFSAGITFGDKLDDNILDIADILVTVPSSKNVFGAFMRGVSVVVAKSVTSLEHDVRRYLVKRALVIPSRTPEETLFAVDELLNEPEREQEFRLRGETYAAMSLQDIANITPKIAVDGVLKIENKS